jgi:mannose-6-phosphate isomerase-like protein (cupin superfamily)
MAMELDVAHSLFLAPGEGEIITERDERSVVIKADRAEVALTDSRYAPGERGPDAHVHRRHSDAFYVLDGALVFALADEIVSAPAGFFVLVPAGVVHTFWNEGPADARFLNIHAPSEGFADYLRALRDGRESDADRFDTFDPPPDGGRPASAALVRGSGEGETLAFSAINATLKAEVGDGDGTFSLSESLVLPGYRGPEPHWHEAVVDSFYVLEGTLALTFGERAVEAPAGSFALAPPGVVHTFRNESGEPVRILNLMAPGGFEQFMKEIARVLERGAPEPGLMAEIASRYDSHVA